MPELTWTHSAIHGWFRVHSCTFITIKWKSRLLKSFLKDSASLLENRWSRSRSGVHAWAANPQFTLGSSETSSVFTWEKAYRSLLPLLSHSLHISVSVSLRILSQWPFFVVFFLVTAIQTQEKETSECSMEFIKKKKMKKKEEDSLCGWSSGDAARL